MERKQLLWQAVVGFIGFFAAVALIQAVVNLFAPEPRVLPGLVAAALVAATWGAWKLRP